MGKKLESSFSNFSVTLPTSQWAELILQPFRHFTYVISHSSSRRFTYVTAHSPTLPSLHLRHSSFSNPSFASPTSPGEPPTVQTNSVKSCLLFHQIVIIFLDKTPLTCIFGWDVEYLFLWSVTTWYLGRH